MAHANIEHTTEKTITSTKRSRLVHLMRVITGIRVIRVSKMVRVVLAILPPCIQSVVQMDYKRAKQPAQSSDDEKNRHFIEIITILLEKCPQRKQTWLTRRRNLDKKRNNINLKPKNNNKKKTKSNTRSDGSISAADKAR